MMQILLIGSKGQLGHDLMSLAQSRMARMFGVDLPECDITDQRSLRRTFDRVGKIELVVNAAAYTAVDKAESDRAAAFAVNRDGVELLARTCRQYKVPLLHVSTDYVFDGTFRRPYLPDDAPCPTSVYGRSKAEGEEAIRQTWDKHIILRTAWLFGLHGANFVKTMLRLGREKSELNIVDDQIGCPTYAGDLAAAILVIANHLERQQAGWGTHHFCNQGAVTWFSFAKRIFDLVRSHTDLAVPRIHPIPTSQYPVPAPRPAYSVLDCSSLENSFGIVRRHWDEALVEMFTIYYRALVK